MNAKFLDFFQGTSAGESYTLIEFSQYLNGMGSNLFGVRKAAAYR